MGLLFWDGFDTGDAVRKWPFIDTANTTVSTTGGRFGGGCLATSAGQPQAYVNITAAATLITGVAFKMDAGFVMSGNNGVVVLLSDSGATTHLSVGNHGGTSNALSIKRGDGTVLATGAIVPNGWHFLEVKATIADTGGTVIVRVDGVSYLSYSGDTKNAGTNSTVDRVKFFGMGNTSGGVLDDIYVCDGTGTSLNDFLGDVRIRTLLPTAAGASTQLTATGVANNWDNVNDVPFSAATFNGSPTVGQRDTYAMGDTVSGDTILAVQACMVAFKSDAGVVSMKTALKSGATVYYGSSVVLATTPGSTFTTTYLTDPATSAAWTVTGVNALEFGAEVA